MDTVQTASETPIHLKPGIRKGRSLQALAAELDRIENTKRDFIVPVDKLTAVVTETKLTDSLDQQPITGQDKKVALHFKNGEAHDFALTKWSGGQVANYTDIPVEYFRRINDQNPELLAQNINHGLRRIQKDDSNKARLIRTLDGNVRGLMSHKYRMLDSFDLMEAIMPTLTQSQFQVMSCELTEKRLYLKTATARVEAEVKVGDVVQFGLMVSTSDVGAGSLRVEPYFLRLWCDNGAVSTSSFRKAHLGRSNYEREVLEIMSDETKQKSDEAFFLTVRDYIRDAMRPEVFQNAVKKMTDAAHRDIKNFDLEEVVELSMKTVGVTGENVKRGIVQALASGNQGAGLTQWGLMNSFTAAAKMDSIDYDQATELERAGGQILDLTVNQWRNISEAKH